MPDLQHRPKATATPGLGVAGAESQVVNAGPGNAAVAEETRSEDGSAAGLANYQASLGAWLGGELYGAVAPHLTLDSLAGYADDGFTGALKGLAGLLENVDGEFDEASIDAFADALAETYETTASEWLESDGQGLAGSLAGWVDAHPKTIVTVALLAAAGAIAANVELPELSKKIGLGGGFDLDMSAKLGKIRAIALEKIQAKLSWTAGALVAAVQVAQEGGETTTTLSGSLGADDRLLKADGKFNGTDLEMYGVEGIFAHERGTVRGSASGTGAQRDPDLKVELETESGGVTRITGVDYEAGTGKLTLRDAKSVAFGDGTLSTGVSHSSDGVDRGSVGWEGGLADGLTGSLSLFDQIKSGADGDERSSGVSGGLAFDKDEWGANLEASLDSGGTDSFSADLRRKFGDHGSAQLGGEWDSETGGALTGAVDNKWGNHSASASGRLNLSAGELEELDAGYRFNDPSRGRGFAADYAYRAEEERHSLSMTADEKFGSVYARFGQKLDLTPQGLASETSAHGAMFLNDDIAAIAGARYQVNDRGDHNVIGEVGLQVKDVPIMFGYDPANEAVSLRLSIPFGR